MMYDSLENLNGRTVFITGASRGIGKAIALTLAAQGANVALFAKTGQEAHPKLEGTVFETAQEIENLGSGAGALPLVGDVRDSESVQEAVDACAQQFGGLDICIANASALDLSPIGELTPKRFNLIQQVNVQGTFATLSAAVPYLEQSDHAHVVTLSPPLNTDPKWFAPGPYTASKYAMTIMTLGVGQENGDINANCVWPATTIATAAVEYSLGGTAMMERSRTPQLVADAVLAVVKRKNYTGHAEIAENILEQEGITDLSAYAAVPGNTQFQPDLYVD